MVHDASDMPTRFQTIDLTLVVLLACLVVWDQPDYLIMTNLAFNRHIFLFDVYCSQIPVFLPKLC